MLCAGIASETCGAVVFVVTYRLVGLLLLLVWFSLGLVWFLPVEMRTLRKQRLMGSGFMMMRRATAAGAGAGFLGLFLRLCALGGVVGFMPAGAGGALVLLCRRGAIG